MTVRIQWRRGTAAQWVTANPILAMGEAGFETDTGLFKMGNGVSPWNSLAYPPSGGVPPGGLTDEVLTKQSGSSGDYVWRSPYNSPLDGGTFN